MFSVVLSWLTSTNECIWRRAWRFTTMAHILHLPKNQKLYWSLKPCHRTWSYELLMVWWENVVLLDLSCMYNLAEVTNHAFSALGSPFNPTISGNIFDAEGSPYITSSNNFKYSSNCKRIAEHTKLHKGDPSVLRSQHKFRVKSFKDLYTGSY